METARETGYICEDQESSLGFYCVAAPVYNYANKLTHGISFTMLKNSWVAKKETAATEIVDLAKRLSEHAGYH